MASCTSSSIWPMFISTLRKALQCLAASQSGALREGPEGDGPDHANLDALGSGRGDGILCHPGRDAEGDDAKRRVLHTIGFIHCLSRLDLAVFFKAFKILLLQLLRLQVQGVDDIMGPLHFRAGGSPTAVKVPGRNLRQLHRLHHLAHRPVSSGSWRSFGTGPPDQSP